jgi:5,6-dimethylbenzimidazole synthase
LPIEPPHFGQDFRDGLEQLFAWRRDVRRFRSDPIAEPVLDELLALANLAPSVGNSQPWRWVRVDSSDARCAIRENFEAANAAAAGIYSGQDRLDYVRLKLEGLREAPVQFAIFCDETTAQGRGLGRQSMPEMLAYSVVISVHAFWLAARARGIGVGWLSVLDPEGVTACLNVPEGWRFVAYLCVGYPIEEHADPELVRSGWQQRQQLRLLKR